MATCLREAATAKAGNAAGGFFQHSPLEIFSTRHPITIVTQKDVLAPLVDSYDWIFIDCPPSLGLLTVNALTASESVIIPVQCEYLPLEGLTRLMQTLDLVRRSLNPELRVLGLVLTMFDRRTRLGQQVVADVISHFPETFDTLIPRTVRLGEAPSHGQSIFRYSPESRAAVAYRRLADELMERVGVPA